MSNKYKVLKIINLLKQTIIFMYTILNLILMEEILKIKICNLKNTCKTRIIIWILQKPKICDFFDK